MAPNLSFGVTVFKFFFLNYENKLLLNLTIYIWFVSNCLLGN